MTGETINGTATAGAASYGYDPVGNRHSRSVASLPLVPQVFTFDANDRLNTDSYDANGNTLYGAGFGQTQPDQYDFENHLVTRRTPTATINIVYDGDGNRVSKTVSTATNTVTTFYVVDELNPSGYAQVLEEQVSLNAQPPVLDCVYTYGHNLISQTRRDGSLWATSFYGYDGHNNVRYLTDGNGNVTDTYDYDAFGNLTAASGATVNSYLLGNPSSNFERVFNSNLPPFDPPSDPRQFFVWVWQEFYPNEEFRLAGLEDFQIEEDINVTWKIRLSPESDG